MRDFQNVDRKIANEMSIIFGRKVETSLSCIFGLKEGKIHDAH